MPSAKTTKLPLPHHWPPHQLAASLITNVSALAWSALLGIFALTVYHIPPLSTVGSLLIAATCAVSLPWLCQQRRHSLDHSTAYSHIDHAQAVSFGLLAASLSATNFLFLFWRQAVSPLRLGNHNQLYAHAISLSLATLVICFISNVLWVYLSTADNRPLPFVFRKAIAIIVVGLLLALYAPGLQRLFATHALDFVDWLSVIAAGALYAALRLGHHHTAKHSRKAVLKLHARSTATKTKS